MINRKYAALMLSPISDGNLVPGVESALEKGIPCVNVNDGLIAWMDVEFTSLREEVSLEVSSPGLERPLTKPEHYHRFAGRLCRIQTRMPINGQKRFKGWIGDATGEAVTVEEDGILKTVPLDAIQKARLAPFDEEKTPKPRLVASAATHKTAGVEKSVD